MPINPISSIEFVRFTTITLIVMGHFEIFYYGGGGSYTLFMIAGITYSKYIMPKLDFQSKRALIDHALLILKIAIPTIFYVILLQIIFDGPLSYDSMFLFSNWNQPKNLSFWFIEVYIQINLILLSLIYFRFTRKLISGLKNFKNALIFFIVTVLASIISTNTSDTSHLFDRVPNQMFWFFSVGILYSASNSAKEKSIFILIVYSSLFLTGKFSWLFSISLLLIVIISNIKLNISVYNIISKISTASLFIYLTHFQWASLYRNISNYESKTMELIFALIGGILINSIYSKLWGLFRKNLFNFIFTHSPNNKLD
jgi:hypothetical protein